MHESAKVLLFTGVRHERPKLTKAQRRELREIEAGLSPGSFVAEKVRVGLKNMGLTYRGDRPHWKWHLTPAGRAALRQEEQADG